MITKRLERKEEEGGKEAETLALEVFALTKEDQNHRQCTLPDLWVYLHWGWQYPKL